jgi:hypothetical protein
LDRLQISNWYGAARGGAQLLRVAVRLPGARVGGAGAPVRGGAGARRAAGAPNLSAEEGDEQVQETILSPFISQLLLLLGLSWRFGYLEC